jgi:hypothetical protein
VPPPDPGLGAWLGRFCKNLICKSLRWLMIRQVEFNSAAVRHAQVSAGFLAEVDKNQAEVVAALTNFALQFHALAERVHQLEGKPIAAGAQANGTFAISESYEDNLLAHQAYLEFLQAREDERIVVLGCRRGDLIRFLVSEGMAVQGIESDADLAEFCRERELPVLRAEFLDYLHGLEDGQLSGIVLQRTARQMSAQQLSLLLGRCWAKLRKGGVLVAEAANSNCGLALPGHESQLPVELLSFLFESQCFSIVDCVFSAPVVSSTASVIQTSSGQPFDRKRYRNYALIGRK